MLAVRRTDCCTKASMEADALISRMSLGRCLYLGPPAHWVGNNALCFEAVQCRVLGPRSTCSCGGMRRACKGRKRVENILRPSVCANCRNLINPSVGAKSVCNKKNLGEGAKSLGLNMAQTMLVG